MRIWVTGIGVVSSIGLNVATCMDSFRAGQRGLRSIRLLETLHKDDFIAGEVLLSNAELMDLLKLPGGAFSGLSRTTLLGMLAAGEACRSAGISDHKGIRTALVSATTVGGMDKSEKDYAAANYSSGFVHTHPCGDSSDRIAEFTGITGYRTTLSTACSSGANAIIHAAGLIRQGYAERVIAGGVDALSKFTLNGFNSLMILDKELCRPFDRDRKGLNLGEGAGYLVLESEKLANRHRERKICRLAGYANTNDAFHQTASSPDGEAATGAMIEALLKGGIEPGQIDYVNVHGTGTENNDASEGAALLRVFGNQVPAFSSTKSFTGHTLGAAAGLEAVFSVLAIQHGMIPPSLGFNNPMEGVEIRPETYYREGLEVRRVLSNSFGFGGNNSSLLFSKI